MRARTHHWMGLVLAVLALPAGLAGPAAAGVIYCDTRATGADNGSSWENAYRCLHNALNSATAGTEIAVAQGTYTPDRFTDHATRATRRGSSPTPTPGQIFASGDRTDHFELRNGVIVKGGYAGFGAPDPNARDIDAYPSILSGDLAGDDSDPAGHPWPSFAQDVNDFRLMDNSYNVVYADRVDSSAILDGFTITGGFANVKDPSNMGQIPRSTMPVLGLQRSGAGAFLNAASPTFIRCTFYRNVIRADNAMGCGGGAVALFSCSPTFQECTFKRNIAFGEDSLVCGGAILSVGGGNVPSSYSNPVLKDCTFVENITAGSGDLHEGGAMAAFYSEPRLTNCSFVGNRALESRGGAVFIGTDASPTFTDCTFEHNEANEGGATYSNSGSPVFRGCTFLRNQATHAGAGGAIFNNKSCSSHVSRCRFVENVADTEGGAMFNAGGPTIDNCLLLGNVAARGAAFFADQGGTLTLLNCTVSANQASERGGGLYSAGGLGSVRNCIFWGDLADEMYLMETGATVRFSDIQGGSGVLGDAGCIDADPQFQDPAGPDGVVGTIDDDLRLSLGSPCIDVGDDSVATSMSTTDLEGKPRISGAYYDMGAYEFCGPYHYYVDAAHGSDANNGATAQKAFATIQKAIDAAQEGYTVFVLPGLYQEEIDFKGKAITVSGLHGAPTIEAPHGYGASFYSTEKSTSILQNFVIRNCDTGVFVAGSAPTIRNVTLSGNRFGIAAYAGANPRITSCILWGNLKGDLFGCKATYSCVQQGSEGKGNIQADPLFADVANGDFHLLSEYGRFVPAYGLWAFDDKTSPCIDAGDPAVDASGERTPNGGRIEMGAFGGTPEASLSECPCTENVNPDGAITRRSQ